MIRTRTFVALCVAAGLAWTGTARADSVSDWNTTAATTIVAAVPPRPAPIFFLDMATVHAAIHDAVQAFEGKYEPYALAIPGASGSIDAAVARAAHDVLVNRFPAQTVALDGIYNAYLAGKGIAADNPGVNIGRLAAEGVILKRSTDGSFPMPPPVNMGGTDPGEWRPTISYLPGPPLSGSPMAVPWLGQVTPFTLTSPTQYRPGPPPAINTGRYTRDYNETKRLGGDVNSERTQEQTDLAVFWTLNFGTQWELAFRDIVAAHVPDIADSARLFALINMAIADNVITAWDCKVTYPLWRPVTAIQEGDNDGNPHTEGDVNWRPFINTPNYPDSCSGANSVTGAATEILSQLYGEHFEFVMTSSNPLAIPPTRTYSISSVRQDVEDVRVYQGIHFRDADIQGRQNGIKVGKWASRHALQPIGQ